MDQQSIFWGKIVQVTQCINSADPPANTEEVNTSGTEHNGDKGELPPVAEEQKPSSKRLVSLDAFRGLTILGMLLVNNMALGTATPRHLTHAPWNQGVYLADFVFPWFLFIVGVAVPYAAASAGKKGMSLRRYNLKVLGRAISLILLGMLVDSSIARQPHVGLGVLQLIGLAYLVAALLYELPVVFRLIVAGLLLVGHWAIIRFFPVPGLGSGIFTESQNAITYLNQMYLTPYHLKGLLSVIPTAAMVLIGTAVGDTLRNEFCMPKWKTIRLLLSGVLLVVLGFLWNLDLPFNKPVWTASYILYTAGWGTLILGLFYLLIDMKGRRKWAYPLVVMGSNAIVAYVVPILVKVYFLQLGVWDSSSGTAIPLQQALLGLFRTQAGLVAGGWMYTASYIVFWWLILLYMYRKKVFLRV